MGLRGRRVNIQLRPGVNRHDAGKKARKGKGKVLETTSVEKMRNRVLLLFTDGDAIESLITHLLDHAKIQSIGRRLYFFA